MRGMFRHALDPHVEHKLGIGEADVAAGDRRGVAIMGGRGERDVALAGQEARGRIETDPARAGQIDFRPGMQVGEVVVGARRPVERDEIGLELDEIAGNEAGGKAEMAEDLDEKPARVAARARGQPERLLRSLDARRHADQVLDVMREMAIELDDEVDRACLRAVELVEESLKKGTGRLRRPVDDEVRPQVLAIVERPVLGVLLDEEVERIIHGHVGDDVDLDLELGDEFRKDVAGEPIAVRVLLVVHEMPGRRHFERMGDDAGAAVRRGAEPDDLRTERNGPVIFVMRQVMDCGSDRHGRARPPQISP